MARPLIKSTYALDPDTVGALERMAQRWRVSKSEALRRAIRAAAGEPVAAGSDALKALDALQRALQLDSARAGAWLRRARAERRRASARGEARG